MNTFQDSEHYHYTSLINTNQIRLLQLHSSHSLDAPLSGELIEAQLNDELEFEALSYAWGEDQNQLHTILVDGAHFPISETLSAALRVFRLSNRSRKIWIDAICINQEDIEERSSQVAQMSAIYKSAAKILIWLGKSTEWTEEVLRFLGDVAASEYRKEFGDHPSGPNWFMFGSRTLKGSNEDIMKIVEGTAKPRLDDIFGRPWFSRLWIIQEIALAKSANLYCGNHVMEWSDFAISLSVLRAAMNTTKIGIAYLSTFLTAWHVVDVKATLQVVRHAYFMSPYNELANFLRLIKDQKCRDDRDRIFGLLGLGLFHLKEGITRGEVTSIIAPDYSRTTSEVYTDVAKHFLIQADLFVLHDAGLWRRLQPQSGCNVKEYQLESSPESPDYLPSWVPEFNNPKSFDQIPWYDDSFNAGLSKSLVRVTVEPHAPFRINLRGKVIDIVARRIGVPGLEGASNMFDTVCNLTKECISAYMREVDPSSRIFGLFELPVTLMGGGTVPSLKRRSEVEGRVPYMDILIMWKHFQDHCLDEKGEVRKAIVERAKESGSVSFNDVLEGLSEDGKKAMAFYHALCDVFEQFQFMITSKGRIGLIPLIAELTDVIFLFPSLPTPYILRQVSGRDDAVVIGPCYIHGMMDGEEVGSILHWDSVWLI